MEHSTLSLLSSLRQNIACMIMKERLAKLRHSHFHVTLIWTFNRILFKCENLNLLELLSLRISFLYTFKKMVNKCIYIVYMNVLFNIT